MADFDNRVLRGAASNAGVIDQGLRAHMMRVYNYMLAGLVLTGAVAWATANTPLRGLFYNLAQTQSGGMTLAPSLLGWVAMLAPLALVFFMSFRIQKMSLGAVQATFWAMTALMGVQIATVLFIYTGTSVAMTFFITASMFGAMSLYGYTTGRDLTGFGSFLMMGLFGLIFVMLGNMIASMFFGYHSTGLEFAINVIGVMVFTGLTAFNTQQIKNMYDPYEDGTMAGKKAVMGALTLYLDFYNMFLFLIRLVGDRR